MRSTRPSDAEIVDRTLRLTREPLASFVQEMIAAAVKEKPADENKLEDAVAQIGRGKQIAELDTRILLRLMERVWRPVFWDRPGKLGRSYAGELLFLSDARSHQEDRKTFGAERFVDTALRLLDECDVAPPDDLRDLRRVASPQARNDTKTFRLIGFDESGEKVGQLVVTGSCATLREAKRSRYGAVSIHGATSRPF